MLWTKNEQARLIEMWPQQTLEHIAAELGRSYSSVRSAIDRYQLRRKKIGTWSAADISALLELWPGYSASLIAERLGRTRNAVIGKVTRLRQEKLELKHGRKPNQLPRPKPAAAVSAIARPPRRRNRVTNMSKRLPIACPCQLVELDAINCKWPFGDPREPGFYFCGAVIADGRPYCAAHWKKAHNQGAYVHGTRSIAAKSFFNIANETAAARSAARRHH